MQYVRETENALHDEWMVIDQILRTDIWKNPVAEHF